MAEKFAESHGYLHIIRRITGVVYSHRAGVAFVQIYPLVCDARQSKQSNAPEQCAFRNNVNKYSTQKHTHTHVIRKCGSIIELFD